MAAGDITQGRRVDVGDEWRDSRPGDYCKVPEDEGIRRKDGQPVWYLRDPRGDVGALMTHTVEEHDDGTITVKPSIDNPPHGWHGFLERGVWREV